MILTAEMIEDRMRTHREWQDHEAERLTAEFITEVSNAVVSAKSAAPPVRVLRCTQRSLSLPER